MYEEFDERPKLCKPCSEQGISVAAHRIVNGVPKCDACFRNQEAPKSNAEEKKPMSKSKDIDWKEVQRRRDAGEKMMALAAELGVSNFTVYTHTKASKNNRPHQKVTPNRKVERAASAASGLNGYLAELRKERDELNAVIAFMEKREAR